MIDTILFNAEEFFSAQFIDLETEMEVVEAYDPLHPETSTSNRIKAVEKELERLNEDLLNRRLQDSMVTARLREELDHAANIKKEDHIIITGLTSKTVMPHQHEEKKQWLNNIVSPLLNQIVPNSAESIVLIRQGRRKDQEIPLVEVKMMNRDIAIKIRKEFAAKKKAGQDFGRVYLANSVTLATRVRVDIMKAMAKKYSTEAEEIFVVAFASRPVLQVRPKDQNKKSMGFTFSDAVVRYGKELQEAELGEAHKRAGIAFRGQLQQNFVVLHDRRAGGAPEWSRWRQGPVGTIGKSNSKRQRDEGPKKPETKKPWKKSKATAN